MSKTLIKRLWSSTLPYYRLLLDESRFGEGSRILLKLIISEVGWWKETSERSRMYPYNSFQACMFRHLPPFTAAFTWPLPSTNNIHHYFDQTFIQSLNRKVKVHGTQYINKSAILIMEWPFLSPQRKRPFHRLDFFQIAEALELIALVLFQWKGCNTQRKDATKTRIQWSTLHLAIFQLNWPPILQKWMTPVQM